MLFGGDGLQKGFCCGSTTNLHFFPYKVSRRSSHSNRGFRRFHKGDLKIYISLYAHDKVQFAMCYWTAQFERYYIEHLNTSCFENTKSFRPCTPLIIYGLMKLSLYYSWRTWSWFNRGRMSRYREFKSSYTRPLWFSQSAFIILLHFINLYLCSAWAVVRIQFYRVILRLQHGISFPRANFAMRTL